MKASILKCLQQINDKQKIMSDELLLNSTRVTYVVSNKIDDIHRAHYHTLSSQQRHAAGEEVRDYFMARTLIDIFTESLDIEDATTEPTEMRLNRVNLENKIETSKRIGNMLSFTANDLGPEHKRLFELRENLSMANENLVNKHIDNVNVGIELEKEIKKEENRGGSLIDDYADTSTEMPSYMDPED